MGAVTGGLSDEAVREIRVRYMAGESQAVLAGRFGTSQAYVSRIVRGLARRGAGGPVLVRSWGEVVPSVVDLR